MPDPGATIEAYADALTGMRDLADEMAPDDWTQAVGCPGWNVQDVVSHINGVERAVAGHPRADHVVDPLPGHVRDDFGARVELEVDYRRSWAPDKVRAELGETVAERLAWLRNVDRSDLDAEITGPFGPTTLGKFFPIRVLDICMHEHDIRRATGRPGHEHGPAPEFTVQRILRLWASQLPIVAPELAGHRIGIEVLGASGGAESAYILDFTGDKGRVTDGGDADVTLGLDVPNLFAWGGGRSDTATPTRSGDDHLATVFLAHAAFTP